MELGHPRHNTSATIFKDDDVETYKPPSGLRYLLDVAMSQSDRIGNVVLNWRRKINRQVGRYKAEEEKTTREQKKIQSRRNHSEREFPTKQDTKQRSANKNKNERL